MTRFSAVMFFTAKQLATDFAASVRLNVVVCFYTSRLSRVLSTETGLHGTHGSAGRTGSRMARSIRCTYE